MKNTSITTEILYQKARGEGAVYLHRLLDPQPRAYLVHEARIVRSDEQTLTYLSRPDFDPQEIVLLSEDPGLDLPGGGGCRAIVVVRDPERMVIEVETEQRGILVLSEIYYPGWRAYVDGEQVKIYRADYLLRFLPLEAGHHRVELIYDPLSFKIGMATTIITSFSVLAFTLASKLGANRRA